MISKNKFNDDLFDSILKLKTLDDCYKFFDDLCTIKEIDAMAQRVQAAKLLIDNNTYEQVISKTAISSATLSRISRCIKYGDGGYKLVLSKSKGNNSI